MFAFITNLNHYASMLCAFVVLFWFCYRVGSAANAAARACGCGWAYRVDGRGGGGHQKMNRYIYIIGRTAKKFEVKGPVLEGVI
jgi:hypothetical protein